MSNNPRGHEEFQQIQAKIRHVGGRPKAYEHRHTTTVHAKKPYPPGLWLRMNSSEDSLKRNNLLVSYGFCVGRVWMYIVNMIMQETSQGQTKEITSILGLTASRNPK